MADTTRVVEEQIVVTDKATKPLGAMATAAGKVRGAFSSIVGIAKGMGGLAGAFAIGKAIHETEKLYSAVGMVKNMTGMTAESSFAMVETFKRGGIELDQATRVITRMEKSMEGVDDIMAGTGQKAKGLQGDYKRLGIDMKAGPEKVLVQMAKATKEGKLNLRDTAKIMGMGTREAGKLYNLLKKGPEELKKSLTEAKNDPSRITESSLASFKAMKKSRTEFGLAWEGLVRIFYTSLMPAITKVMSRLTGWIEQLKEPTAAWGQMLSDYLSAAADHLGVIIKMLAANKALFMLTGKGLLGTAGGAMVRGSGAGIRAAAGRGAEWASGGAMGGGPATLMRGIGGAMGGFMGIVKALLKIGGLAIVFTIIVAAFSAIMKHSEGIRSLIAKVLDSAGALFKQIMDLFAPDATLGKALTWIAETILKVMDAFINGVRLAVKAFQFGSFAQAKDAIEQETKTKQGMRDYFATWEKLTPERRKAEGARLRGGAAAAFVAQSKEFGVDVPQSYLEAVGMAEAKARIPTPSDRRGATVNQDFRGSKFDIKQEFAEGFDPDKIAVLMANQIAELGERRLQSGLSPLFALK